MRFYVAITAVVVCLLASVVPIPGTDVWYSQFVAVALFGFLLVAVLISEMSISIGILFAYLTISTVFIAHQDTMSLICLAQVALCLMFAKVISCLEAEKRKKIWVAVFCILIIQVVWGFIQYFNLDPFFKLTTDPRLSDTVGFSGSHNQYGLMMVSASPSIWLFPYLLPFIIIAVILSKTFSAFIGLACAWLFLLRNRFNFSFLISMIFIVGLCIMTFQHKELLDKYKERFGIWQLTASQVLKGKAVMQSDNPNVKKIVTCNPLFGFGFQKFYAISPYTQRAIQSPNARSIAVFEHAHNDYVEALFDLGIIGFLLVAAVIIELVFLFYFPAYSRGLMRTIGFEKAAAGLIAYAACAFSIYTVHTAYNGLFLCVLLGLFYGEVRDGQKRRQ